MREPWRSDSSRKSGSNKNKSCMFMGRYHTKLQSSVTHFLQFKSLPPVLQILSKKAKTSCFCSFWHVLVILFLRYCIGTALCNPACMVDSTSRLCFHITEAHIMNDNMQKWLENALNLWEIANFKWKTWKYSPHGPLLLMACIRDNYWQGPGYQCFIDTPVEVTGAGDKGTVVQGHCAAVALSWALTDHRTFSCPSAPSLGPDSAWTQNAWLRRHFYTSKIVIH